MLSVLSVCLACACVRVLCVASQGVACIVYDIIVHPSVVTEALADKTGNFRHWVCNFTLQYVQQKHGVQVSLVLSFVSERSVCVCVCVCKRTKQS